jgi:hypothetical protein
MALRSNQVQVGTGSPAKLFDGIAGTVTIVGAAAYFLGGPNVTAGSTGNGVPCGTAPVLLQVSGEAVYAIASVATQVGYIAGGQ